LTKSALLNYDCRQMHLVTGTAQTIFTATAFSRDYASNRFRRNWHTVIARSALRDEAISTDRALRRPRLLRYPLAMTIGVSGAILSESAIISQEQQETATEQRGASLFFRPPNRHRPRISAGNEILVADYLREKQQKQRELPFIG
jgi:hypothetical protein